MEHRWGTRQMLDVGVRLYCGSEHPIFGRMLNASSSGAFITTSTKLPVMTRVHVLLGWGSHQNDRHHRIAAYVVRADERGLAIEWQEFTALPVPDLMDDAVPALMDDWDSLPARKRESASLRHRNDSRGAAQNEAMVVN